MSLDADLIVDRRRMRRKLTFWRVFAVLILIAAVVAIAASVKRGAVVTTEVTEVKDSGIDVKIVGTDFTAFIKRNELARDRSEQRPERFAVGQKVDARVTQFDKKARKVGVSIKALEVAEEKEAIAQFGSSDSGATLGDILGTALKQRDKKDD